MKNHMIICVWQNLNAIFVETWFIGKKWTHARWKHIGKILKFKIFTPISSFKKRRVGETVGTKIYDLYFVLPTCYKRIALPYQIYTSI